MITQNQEQLKLDYEQTVAYFLHLSDVRFKLLALLPIATAVTVLLAPEELSPAWLVGLSRLGFIVTLGLTIYDQRNTQIYDRLVKRAKALENLLDFPIWDKIRNTKGSFNDRPPRLPFTFLPLVWHDLALAVVYSASLSAWCFMAENVDTAAKDSQGVPDFSTTKAVFFCSLGVLVGLAIRNDVANWLAESGKRLWPWGHVTQPAAPADQKASLPGR